jgi:hypothetical protein
MSVETNLITDQRTLAPTVQDSGRPRSAGRIIGASLVSGALIALVPTLAVFAGGTEAFISGSMLLGFGLGMGLLATLSQRRTSQPQRWAVVPAVVMSATGMALPAFRPGDDTITALSWVLRLLDDDARRVDVRPVAPLPSRPRCRPPTNRERNSMSKHFRNCPLRQADEIRVCQPVIRDDQRRLVQGIAASPLPGPFVDVENVPECLPPRTPEHAPRGYHIGGGVTDSTATEVNHGTDSTITDEDVRAQ